MKLTFSPIRMDDKLKATVCGDVLVLNEDSLDFGPIPPGATLPRTAIDCRWIAGDVSRDEVGVLTVPLILPHGADAPDETLFPLAIETEADGPVPIPAASKTPLIDPEPENQNEQH